MRRLAALVAVAGFACGGGGDEAGESAVDLGPDTLPASIEAPEIDEGFLLVTPQQVHAWQEAGEPFVLIDARDAVQYGREHIPGAINVPYVDIRAGANLPSPDTKIVLYCSDPECPISQYAYETLQAIGFTNLYDMREGIAGWKAEGYPTVVGEETPALPRDTTSSTQSP